MFPPRRTRGSSYRSARSNHSLVESEAGTGGCNTKFATQFLARNTTAPGVVANRGWWSGGAVPSPGQATAKLCSNVQSHAADYCRPALVTQVLPQKLIGSQSR